MARSFKMDADLLVTSCAAIEESRQLLASLRSDRVLLSNVDGYLLANSRAMIDESRRLLARLTVEIPTAPMEPTVAGGCVRPDGNSAMLSILIFQEGSRFAWTLNTHDRQVLGHGTAGTELSARVDALGAGKTYIDRVKGRSSSSDSSLH